MMKNDPRRLAVLGLVLSSFAGISLVIIFVMLGLSSVGIYQPADPESLNKAIWICSGLVVLGIALTVFLDPERTRIFLSGRQIKYGSNAILLLVSFSGILIFLNIIAFQNPVTWDLTENQKNTLSQETVNLLRALPDKVVARAYYSARTDPTTARKLLINYQEISSSKFAYEFVDPETNPIAAKQDGIDRDATIVLTMSGLKELVTYPDEKELDIALMRLINPTKRQVYFLTGHGEADIDQTDENSYSLIKSALETRNYLVSSLNLGSKSRVPDDAKVIIVPGPQTPLQIDEVKSLEEYLNQGGSMIIMEDPRALTKFGEKADPLALLIEKWGITFQNDIIYDPNANPPLLVYSDPLNYGQHPITEKMRGINSRFFTSQSLSISEAKNETIITPIAQTYSEAWGETDTNSIESSQVSFDKSKDIPGPLILAVTAENPTTKGRLVIFGDSEFAANGLYKLGNGEILINSIDWATIQEDILNLSPKKSITRTYNAPGSVGLISTILLSLCVIPLLIITGGITTWYSRRKKG